MSNQNVIDGLNGILADSIVMYQKLHHYHWRVKGRGFYQLHGMFEGVYDEFAEVTDSVAERILMVGGAPLASLAQAGVTANGLRLNAKSQNQSGVGVPVIFLTDPGARYLIECKRFLAVADRDPASDSASYTVRLHTAERAKLQPGQRVFDIAIQGQALVKGLDIAKETGGAGIPFVKELKGVAAGRTLRIDLQPVEGKGLPLLCAVEVVRE